MHWSLVGKHEQKQEISSTQLSRLTVWGKLPFVFAVAAYLTEMAMAVAMVRMAMAIVTAVVDVHVLVRVCVCWLVGFKCVSEELAVVRSST